MIGYIPRRTPISAKRARSLGWTRVDARPWGKLGARWVHVTGWTLAHCGHPTAHHPWMLRNPAGEMILTGAGGEYRNPAFGTCWNSLDDAMGYVDGARIIPAAIGVADA